jgi:cyclophilin family peptidyl-prolyl cis-trans isomerase
MSHMLMVLLLAPALVSGAPEKGGNPVVTLETSKGTIVLELDAAKAPATVANFLAYVKAGFYNGTIFHRVIPGFMIQGGGFTAEMEQKPTRPPIANESGNGLANLRGTIAMARTNDPNSATSQFFINLKDNAFLDKARSQDKVGYCVFGRVVKGLNVVDAIAAVPTGIVGGYQDVPTTPVTIVKVVVQPAAAKPAAAPPSGQR